MPLWYFNIRTEVTVIVMMVDFFKTKMKKVNSVLMKKYKLTELK